MLGMFQQGFIFFHLIFTVLASISQDKSELTHGERYKGYQKCFKDRHAHSKLALVETNVQDVLQIGQKECFEPLTLNELFPESHTSKAEYLEHFDNLTAKHCPGWSNSSKCFYDFINQNCSHGDIHDIMNSPAAGKSLVLTELVCNDENDVREMVRGYLNASLEQGLLECYKESKPLQALFNSCHKLKCSKKTLLPLVLPFDECIGSYFGCVQSFFELCVPVDRIHEARELWTSIEMTFKKYHKLLHP